MSPPAKAMMPARIGGVMSFLHMNTNAAPSGVIAVMKINQKIVAPVRFHAIPVHVSCDL
jgi:hypothetical protein